MLKTWALYAVAALFEIAGCYSLWVWWKLKATPLWLIPGVLALIAFGFLLAQVDSDAAGRAYAGYGAVYIAASIGWMWWFEKQRPDVWDLTGMAVCLIGAGIILFAPRSVS